MKILEGTRIRRGCLIGKGVTIGPNVTLDEFQRVSRHKPEAKEEDEDWGPEEGDEDRSIAGTATTHQSETSEASVERELNGI